MEGFHNYSLPQAISCDLSNLNLSASNACVATRLSTLLPKLRESPDKRMTIHTRALKDVRFFETPRVRNYAADAKSLYN